MALFAKVKIQVQADLAVDLVDHLPLVERLPMIRSGRLDANALVKNVSPRTLLDSFVRNLSHAVKPVSSFFGDTPRDAYDFRQEKLFHEQSYSAVLHAGVDRTAEVVVGATVVSSAIHGLKTSENGALVQDSGVSSLSSVAQEMELHPEYTDSEAQPEVMSSKFDIQVTFEPLDKHATTGMDFLCATNQLDIPIGSVRKQGEMDHTEDLFKSGDGNIILSECSEKSKISSSNVGTCSQSSVKACETSTKLESSDFSRQYLGIANKTDTGYEKVLDSSLPSFSERVKVEPVTQSYDHGIQSFSPRHATKVRLNLNAPDEGDFFASPSLEDMRINPDIISPKVMDLHENHERDFIVGDSVASDTKPTIFGQKRVVFDAGNSVRVLPPSTSNMTIKCESIEESLGTSELDNTWSMDVSTSNLQEKSLKLCPFSSAFLVNMGSEVIAQHSSPSYCYDAANPILELKQPISLNGSDIAGIQTKLEASESNAIAAISDNSGLHLVASKLALLKTEVESELRDTALASVEDVSDALSPSNKRRACVKVENIEDFISDASDNISLRERMNMITTGKGNTFDDMGSLMRSKRARLNSSGSRPETSENIIEQKSGRCRKRKKTATDSVEIALEEDAPGLLQVLVEQGINLEEIKLYGSMDDDDDVLVEVSSNDDGFEELENVISKLFNEPSDSFLNFASSRGRRGSKAVYCLACLVSLIEQTQYLQFRQCPVQWGWCRDLQSFIFVFEKHNRIVLERPEYGYATYFFELVESLPIDWQIKRLVTAMKAAYCSRVTIVENRPLKVHLSLKSHSKPHLPMLHVLPAMAVVSY